MCSFSHDWMSPSNWNQEKRVLTVAGWISCYINKLILIRFILFWMKIIKKKVKLEGFPIILLSLSGRGSSPYTSKNDCCFYIWSCHCISLKLLNSNVFFKMSLSNDFIFFAVSYQAVRHSIFSRSIMPQ